MHNFADENKWDLSNVPGSQIAQEYEEKRTDAWANIEELGIIKRIVSICKLEVVFLIWPVPMNLSARMVQASRAQNSNTGISRSNTTSTTSTTNSSLRPAPPAARSALTTSYKKAPPPPPPSLHSHAAAPPPYTPTASASSLTSATRDFTRGQAVATKRPPPPPPPLKPKPKPAPRIKYVVALYDFSAQVGVVVKLFVLNFHVTLLGGRRPIVQRRRQN